MAIDRTERQFHPGSALSPKEVRLPLGSRTSQRELPKNMKKNKKISIFEGRGIRREWNEQEEKWYFSVVDMVAALTEQADFQAARNYWKVLKNRLNNEGSETVTKCNRLKMLSADGKMRLTDVADTEVMLRLIQSIPSPRAEPFKLWLARVGYERIEETHDPELAINRALNTYLKKGYSESWINQRLKSIEIRKVLTDEWEKQGFSVDLRSYE